MAFFYISMFGIKVRWVFVFFPKNMDTSDHSPLKIPCVKLRTIGTFLLFEPCGARRVQKCGVMVQVETQDQNFSRGCISLLTFFVQAKKVSRLFCKKGRNR
ncbi:hypothetical protein A6A20_07810 [Volucribacter amazonae]|uniref:Uncharacterized protein n=1 Tax=Volucribacter amazonae TaxID=256731 RepID=A0A9X4SID0_9PAST|nr:hypothetical protein [Volucribacter amazonae]